MQREKNRPFLKITLALPSMVSVARGVLEKGMIIPGLSNTPLVLPTFESNVLFILRFMVDCKVRHGACRSWLLTHISARPQVTGGNWVQLPPGAWQHTKRRVSTCQVWLFVASGLGIRRLKPSHAARGGRHVQPACEPRIRRKVQRPG